MSTTTEEVSSELQGFHQAERNDDVRDIFEVPEEEEPEPEPSHQCAAGCGASVEREGYVCGGCTAEGLAKKTMDGR